MPVTIEMEMKGDEEALEAVENLRQGLEEARDRLREVSAEASRNGFVLRDFYSEILLMDQKAAGQREAMTKETFETWIGYATKASDWTRRAFNSAIGSVGQGIANELVDGTHDWQTALKGVLKQMIAITVQMAIMRTLMSALTGGTAGWADFFHAGGRVMHSGGPVRAHSGLALRDDEVPVVAQRGEFILRRRAVERIGVPRLEKMNKGAATGEGGPTFNITVNVPASNGTDAARLARELGPEIVRFLRDESGRGVIFARP